MMKAIVMANRNISGARTATRMIIIKAIWTLVTSVVMRVTSEAEEKRSMFSKEKSCTRTNMSRRRLRAKPVEASAQVRAAAAPHSSDSTAMITSLPPSAVTSSSGAPALIMLTTSAVKKGIRTSKNTSPTMASRVSSAGFLFSRRLWDRVLITKRCTSFPGMIHKYG